MKLTFVDLNAAIERDRRLPYDPGESPIEDIFSWTFKKFADDNVSIESQHDIQTPIGNFRLDFVIQRISDGYKIAIECDGKDFHTLERDVPRDAAIIATRNIKRVYRIRGRDIVHRIHDVFHMLSFREPWVFSETRIQDIEILSAPSYFRSDAWGEMSSGFPFGMMRRYEDQREYDPDEEVQEEEDIGYRQPTIICWTE